MKCGWRFLMAQGPGQWQVSTPRRRTYVSAHGAAVSPAWFLAWCLRQGLCLEDPMRGRQGFAYSVVIMQRCGDRGLSSPLHKSASSSPFFRRIGNRGTSLPLCEAVERYTTEINLFWQIFPILCTDTFHHPTLDILSTLYKSYITWLPILHTIDPSLLWWLQADVLYRSHTLCQVSEKNALVSPLVCHWPYVGYSVIINSNRHCMPYVRALTTLPTETFHFKATGQRFDLQHQV